MRRLLTMTPPLIGNYLIVRPLTTYFPHDPKLIWAISFLAGTPRFPIRWRGISRRSLVSIGVPIQTSRHQGAVASTLHRIAATYTRGQMYTPSGRFQPDKRICFSMSDFHPGTVRNQLVSLHSSRADWCIPIYSSGIRLGAWQQCM